MSSLVNGSMDIIDFHRTVVLLERKLTNEVRTNPRSDEHARELLRCFSGFILRYCQLGKALSVNRLTFWSK